MFVALDPTSPILGDNKITEVPQMVEVKVSQVRYDNCRSNTFNPCIHKFPQDDCEELVTDICGADPSKTK